MASLHWLRLFCALVGLWTVSALATELPFDIQTDALCFKNSEPDLAKTGIPVFGYVGMKKGVCQGIAGISAAFRENVEFEPAAVPESASTAVRLINLAVRMNREHRRAKVTVHGYRDLMDFCRANRMAFLRKSIEMNAKIGLSDIVFPHLLQFERLKKTPIGSQKHPEALRRQLAETLATAQSELREGRYPLLLYFSHVVLLRGLHEVKDASGARQIDLEIYDSNHPESLQTVSVTLAADGLPDGANRMYWVLHAGQ